MSEDSIAAQSRIDAAEREVLRADRRLAKTAAQLKTHASRLSSYSAPLAVAGGLVALRVLKRAFRQRKDARPASVVRPVRAGLTALLLRMGLPAVMGFARQQADTFANPAQGMSGSLPPPRVSATLDSVRFAGRWFEVSCLRPLDEREAARQMGEQLSLVVVPDATGFEVQVTTRDAAQSSHSVKQRTRRRHGRLRAEDPAHPAQLSITLAPSWLHWLPAVWGDYWVLEIGRNYGFALVGDKDRSDLRVLARAPSIDPTVHDQLMHTAREEGYPVDRMSMRGPVETHAGAAAGAAAVPHAAAAAPAPAAAPENSSLARPGSAGIRSAG